MMISTVLYPVLANARLTLPKGVLPFNFDDPAISIPFTNSLAIIVREYEPSFVRMKQIAQKLVAETIMMHRKIPLRVNTTEHFAVIT